MREKSWPRSVPIKASAAAVLIAVACALTACAPAKLSADNAHDLIGCRVSLQSASGVKNELGKAVESSTDRSGNWESKQLEVRIEFGWFDDLGRELKTRNTDTPEDAWVTASTIKGYTCDGGETWIRFND